MSVWDNYECDGQINLFDYLEERDSKVYDLNIKGICDDPYCPNCGYLFSTYGSDKEIDCERCPECKIRVDWARWHKMNDGDEEGKGIPLDELIERERGGR